MMDFYRSYIHNTTADFIRELFKEHGVCEVYKKNSDILVETDVPDKSYMVKTGSCSYLFPTNKHTYISFGFVFPGGTFGETPAFNRKETQARVVTIEKTEIVTIPIKLINDSIKQDGDKHIQMLAHMAEKNERFSLALMNTLSSSLIQRFAFFIKAYIEEIKEYKENAEYYIITLKLPHERIAELLGASRVATTVLLHYLASEKLLKQEKTMLFVKKIFINMDYICNELAARNWSEIRGGERLG